MTSHEFSSTPSPVVSAINQSNLRHSSPCLYKLQGFCRVVRNTGLRWAWSDTCCINKANHFLRQEALILMFKWYQGSALTVVYLCDVLSPSRRGDLIKSIWNTRAWPLQEYHASKVVRFYTKDWSLYMNLDIPNHKESPEIISEMDEATDVSAALMTLQPEALSSFDAKDDSHRGYSIPIARNIFHVLTGRIWNRGPGPRATVGTASHELGGHEHPGLDWKIWELQ